MDEEVYEVLAEKRTPDVIDEEHPVGRTLYGKGPAHYVLGWMEVAVKEGWIIKFVRPYREWRTKGEAPGHDV